MKAKTVWKYSLNTESNRLLHCARQIAVDFYKINNFIVLPFSPKLTNTQTVTFPDLPYVKIPRFWDRVRRINVENLPLKIELDLVQKVEDLLQKSRLPEPNYIKTKNLWSKVQNEVIAEIYKVMPGKKGAIKKIVIYPTRFGTSSSFNFINKKGEVIMYLKDDQGIHTITEAIVTSLTRKEVYDDLEGTWSESEIITDWLVTKSSIGKILQKYEPKNAYIPTIRKTRIKEQAKLIAETNEFYKKLGVPITDRVFGLNGKTPEINKKPIENLSTKEREIMKKLIEKKGEVLSYDDIEENADNFSLYAISKTIQRLRDKLEENGISGSYIQTLRGKGYLLKN